LVVSDNDLVEGIVFISGNFLRGENLRSMIMRRWCLCIVPFFETLLLEKLDFLYCLDGVSTIVLRKRSP
jgi:hypothetical protein